MQLLSSSVDVCLSSFGSSARGCVRFASSAPRCIAGLLPPFPKPALKASSEVVLGRLYRGLAAAMLAFLHVRVTGIPPLQAAQIGTGAQPRKAVLSPVPEFKLFMQVPLSSVPKLDCKKPLEGALPHTGSRGARGFQALAALYRRDISCWRWGCVEQLSLCTVIYFGGDTFPCPRLLPCLPRLFWFRGCRLRP